MGLFNRKKKPWDYNTRDEKLRAIFEDYRNDEKIIINTIKKESDMLVKVHAANVLFNIKQLPDNPLALIACLVGDVGLSENEAEELLQAIGEYYVQLQNQGLVG